MKKSRWLLLLIVSSIALPVAPSRAAQAPAAASPGSATTDLLEAARTALAAGRVDEAAQAAEKAHAAAPKEREPLEFLVAVYDAQGNEAKAKVVYKKLGALPKGPGPVTQDVVPVLVNANPGQTLFVSATRLKVRSRADRTSVPVIELLINTPVKATRVDGDWVQIEASEENTGWRNGYAHRAFLSTSKADAVDMVAEADAKEKANQLVDATRLLERVLALKPADRSVAERLARVATAAHLYPAAVDAALRLGAAKPRPVTEACPACPDGPAVLSKNVLQMFPRKNPVTLSGEEYALECWDVGTFLSGPYKGRTLSTCMESFPLKSDGPYDNPYLRLAIGDGKATLLELNSDRPAVDELKAPLSQHYKFNVDNTWFVHDLRPYPVLHEDQDTRVLVFYSTFTFPATSKQKRVFRHRLLGDVNAVATDASENGLLTVSQPDGLTFVYVNIRKFTDKDVQWVGVQGGKEYRSLQWSCQPAPSEMLSSVEPVGVSEADLYPVGTIGTTGSPVFALKSPKHPALAAAIKDCRAHLPEGAPDHCAKITGLPLYFFRDAFGRLVELRNADLRAPSACEPVLYLYPTATTQVRVKLDERVQQIRSIPPHGKEGWSVLAHPDGLLVDLNSGASYRFLFWEGHSLVLEPPAQGFVVARDDMEGFLRRTLTELGLQGAEIEGFLHAWLKELTQAPYCFIGFHDQAITDALFPLHVEPHPDVTLRILMDYELLDEPRVVEPPHWGPPSPRTGFTVVEWGGIRR